MLRRITGRYGIPVAVLLIACLAAGPLFAEAGLLNTRGGGDSPFLLQRVHQFATAIGDGHFPVRWMPDANYGYGYPFFNYYAPLSIAVAAFFRLFDFSYVLAIKLAQLAGFLLAGWGMYQLARRWLGNDWGGLLAAAAYTLAPFHMVNVYVRGDSLAEFWAMALYPLVLLAADEAVNRPDRRSMLLLAISYAALILSHNISALIFSPFLLLYLLIALWRHGSRPALLGVTGGLLFGLLLSGWFWLPALVETSLVQTDPVTSGYFAYTNHFLANPVQSSWLFDYDVAGRVAFRMGLAQVLLAMAGLGVGLWALLTKRNQGDKAGLFFVFATLLISTFMLLSFSKFLWDALPLLPFTQFPWRFLSVQALATALLAGLLAWLPGRWLPRLVVVSAIALLLVAGLGWLETDHLPLADADASPLALAQYEWFTGNIGSTVSAEYLPYTVQPRPNTSSWLNIGDRERAVILSGQGAVTQQGQGAARQTWELDINSEEAVIMFPLLYWPGWAGKLNDTDIALQAAPGSGLVMVSGIPAGMHTLTLRLTRTPIRLVGELLSLAALVGAVGLLLTSWRFRPGRGWLILPVAILGLFVAGRLWPEPEYPAGTETWDFAQLGYLHHAPEGIHFSDGSQLSRYHYSTDTVRPGEPLTINLEWAAAKIDQPLTLELVTPAVHRLEHVPVLATRSTISSAGMVPVVLELPENIPAGLVVPRLTFPDAVALTPSGQPRGDLFLRPLWIVDDPGESIGEHPAGFDVVVDDVLVQGAMPVQQPAGWMPPVPFGCNDAGDSTGEITVKLIWQTDAPLSENLLVSLRLLDSQGRELVLCDSQPGHGFLPSSGWPAGQPVHDWLGLPLPPQLTTAAPYYLTARLYTPDTGRVALTRQLGALDWQEGELVFRPVTASFVVPDDIEPAGITFEDRIILHGYEMNTAEESLNVRLVWGALAPGNEDFQRFVHLVDMETGEIIRQSDGVPLNDTYPTGQWAAGEVVEEVVVLDVTELPAGTYRVAVGLYRNAPDFPRLQAIDAAGRPVPDNRVWLDGAISSE